MVVPTKNRSSTKTQKVNIDFIQLNLVRHKSLINQVHWQLIISNLKQLLNCMRVKDNLVAKRATSNNLWTIRLIKFNMSRHQLLILVRLLLVDLLQIIKKGIISYLSLARVSCRTMQTRLTADHQAIQDTRCSWSTSRKRLQTCKYPATAVNKS